MFLRQCVNTGDIPFRIGRSRPIKELLEAMDEAEAMAKNPNTPTFDTVEELI